LPEDRPQLSGLVLEGRQFRAASNVARIPHLQPVFGLVCFLQYYAKLRNEFAARSSAACGAVVGRDAQSRSEKLTSDFLRIGRSRQRTDEQNYSDRKFRRTLSQFLAGHQLANGAVRVPPRFSNIADGCYSDVAETANMHIKSAANSQILKSLSSQILKSSSLPRLSPHDLVEAP
jgi:hypothetical protein